MLVLASSQQQSVVVGDIGGTNARLSLWVRTAAETPREVYFKIFPTQNYSSMESVLDEFLLTAVVRSNPPAAAALACAGPVEDNRCSMTNLSWVVDAKSLSNKYKMKYAVLNDFEAVGYGVPALEAEDMYAFNVAPVKAKAPKVVMGPGTGLGAATLTWDEGLNAYRVWPGEGGHATFAPRGWKQIALANYVTQKFGFCELEHLACGSGLELIYEFLLSDEYANSKTLRSSKPKTNKEISQAAIDGTDPLALETVELFLAIVGAEAGNMGLRTLAKGGVYVAGGLTPKLLKFIKEGAMQEGFLYRTTREKFQKILESIPAFAVVNERVGIIGTREYAYRLL